MMKFTKKSFFIDENFLIRLQIEYFAFNYIKCACKMTSRYHHHHWTIANVFNNAARAALPSDACASTSSSTSRIASTSRQSPAQILIRCDNSRNTNSKYYCYLYSAVIDNELTHLFANGTINALMSLRWDCSASEAAACTVACNAVQSLLFLLSSLRPLAQAIVRQANAERQNQKNIISK